MKSRRVDYSATIWVLGKSKPPNKSPHNAEVRGAPICVMSWQRNTDCNTRSHVPAARVLKMISLCFVFFMSFHKNILFGFFLTHLKIL